MSEWKVDPALLSAALSETTVAYEPLTTAVTEESVAAIFGGLTWGSWVTSCVSQALSEVLAEQQTVNLANISNHIAAGITGVGNSAWALQQGQEDMAATFQSEMSAAAVDGDFSFFEAHGYRGE
ncbi:DUF6507 family protein [Microbacterium sp. SA39]|uniref:DUF6507 family protein n=1 Tax=Microbacterium sp. SA39 TaxID=1263625 RepID=UPI00061F0F89|nr:DUF6507 family protein [Microbacterium sp. SA39]KJQ54623.1 hypothetical protein RS85_01777 [Microbacterium sp. SA39]